MDDETKPKQKAAKDNPWYRLATLHGEPASPRDECVARNRETWNRWMAPRLSEGLKAALRYKGWSDQELTPFSDAERQAIKAQVGAPLETDEIDFSNTRVAADFSAQGFIFHDVGFNGTTFSSRADFESAIFSGSADFESATFSVVVSFVRATFGGYVRFSGATFGASAPTFESATFRRVGADFESAIFSGRADFQSAKFVHLARFESATFSGAVRFVRATFRGNAHFNGATFRDIADFTRATFGIANFESATFSASADFWKATFSGNADFSGATFSGSVTFDSTTFKGDAYFRGATFSLDASFVNAEMKGPTTFDNVRFSEPPKCFGAKLHEGTTWHRVQWPKTPSDPLEAVDFADAYARLKLEMDKLKKHEDELTFFALEQQCRAVVDGRWKGLPIEIYGWVSDYGRSYVRPLVLILAVVLVGQVLVGLHLVGFWAPIPGRAFGLSFANTFSVLGIRREFTDPDTVKSFPAWLTVVSAVQSMLGIVLLFLFGLGIRNRFRIK